MKKLLLIAILMLALVITAVACTETPDEPDTSAEDTTVENPTETPTDEPDETPAPEVTTPAEPENTAEPEETTEPETPEETTEPETPEETTEPETTVDPDEPLLVIEPEFILEQAQSTAGATVNNEIASSEVITEGNKTFVRLTSAGGDPYVAVINLNGNQFLSRYMAISYRTNSTTEGQFFMGSGQGWTGVGDAFGVTWIKGDWSFMIVDLDATGVTSITDYLINYARLDFFADNAAEGDYFDVQYIAFFNSVEAAQKYDFKVNPPYVETSAAGLHANSFDTFYVNNQMYFEADGGAGDKLTAINDTITFAAGQAHDSMMLRGWIGFDQPIVSFGYYLDNYNMVWGDFARDTEQAVKNAGGEHASRFEITVPLADLKANDHFAGFVVKLEDGTIARLRADIIVDLPDDIANTFVSDVASNEDGTDLQTSDLANYFTITYGAGDPHVVTGGQYQYGGINELYADVDGMYAFSINMQEAANTAMMFVRGTHVIHSVDVPTAADGLYPINNYYETDGDDLMGGAGIYAALYGGKLNIMIKVYDDATKTHVANKHYAITADGTEVTMADDGQNIYILVDGQLCATIALTGEATYEKLSLVQPEVTFAQTAVVTLCDGTTETLENTLVASTSASQIGIALRPATMKFDSIKVQAFSDVEIPAEFYVPVVKVNAALNKPVSADSVENEINIPANVTDGDDTTRWGALPKGVANLVVDLEQVYTLTGIDTFFENASWDYTISVSTDGETYEVIHNSAKHAELMLKLTLDNVSARYIKFTRLEDDGADNYWFSIYEVYVYTVETATPDEEPEVKTVTVDLSTVTPNSAAKYEASWGAAGYSVPVVQMMNYGSAASLGEMDLSKYSAVVITYGSDASGVQGDIGSFLALTKNGAVENADSSDKTDTEIIAQATMSNATGAWAGGSREVTIAIDSDYVGEVHLAQDMKDGNGIAISSIVFIAK